MVFRPTSTVDAVNFTAFAVVFLTTAVRLAARRARMSKLSLDDYLVSFAVAFGLAYVLIIHFQYVLIEETYHIIKKEPDEPGLGFPPKLFSPILRSMHFDNFTQIMSVSLAKLSLLAFYRSITSSLKNHLIVLHSVEGLIILNALSQSVLIFFSSKPLACNYNFEKYVDVCEWPIDTIKVMMVCGSVQALIDLILIILPWFVMWNLKINMRMKVKLVLMYSAGFITLAFSVVRVIAINTKHLTRLRWLEAQAPFALWSMVEAFAAILCVNVPALVGAIAKWRKAKQLKNESLQLREYKCYADEASKRSRKSSRNMSTKNPDERLLSDITNIDSEKGLDNSIVYTTEFRATVDKDGQ